MKLLEYQSPDVVKVVRRLNLGPAVSVPLVANAITITTSHHAVITPAGTTVQRSLRTIVGGNDGDVLLLRLDPSSTGQMILDDNAGNIMSAGNFTLSSQFDVLALLCLGATWVEITRSNNA